MPLLGGLLVNLFGGVVLWLTQFVTRKIAFGVTAVAMMSFLTGTLFVLMRAILASLNMGATGMPAIFAEAVALGVPPVATLCLGSYITCWTACTVYAWQRDLVKVLASA